MQFLVILSGIPSAMSGALVAHVGVHNVHDVQKGCTGANLIGLWSPEQFPVDPSQPHSGLKG